MHVYSVFFFQDLPLVKGFNKVLPFAIMIAFKDLLDIIIRWWQKRFTDLTKASVSSFERPFNLLEHAAKLTLLPYWEIQIGI
jgi:hypothetical protein